MFSTLIKYTMLPRIFKDINQRILYGHNFRIPFVIALFLLLSESVDVSTDSVIDIKHADNIQHHKSWTCRTCFAYCTNINQCNMDCANSNNNCTAPHCFTRLDLVENGYLALQAGCSNFNPGKRLASGGCYVSGPPEEFTQYCYCKGDLCNQGTELPPEQLVPGDEAGTTCCQWRAHISSDQDPDTTWAGSCPSQCSLASYCSTNFVDQTKTCGFGLPGFYRDLWPNTGALENEEELCLRYDAGNQFRSHHCVCSTDNCNKDVHIPQYPRTDQVKCHACHQSSQGDFITGGTCHHDDACLGQLCFLSYTTAELTQDYDFDTELYGPPQMESGIYDLTMGCLGVNRPEVVRIGCRAEWKNATEPISVHCICNEVGCNSVELLAYELGRVRHTANGQPTMQSPLEFDKHDATSRSKNHELFEQGEEQKSGDDHKNNFVRHDSSSSDPNMPADPGRDELGFQSGMTEERVSSKCAGLNLSNGAFSFGIYLSIVIIFIQFDLSLI